MENVWGIVSILLPMFLGFAVRIPKLYVPILERMVMLLVYVLLLTIGIHLSQVSDLLGKINQIAIYVISLFALLMFFNIASLMWFERCVAWKQAINPRVSQQKPSLSGGLQQAGVVLFGALLGYRLPEDWLPPENTGYYALILLIFFVGMQMRGNGIPLRQIILNRRGVQMGAVFVVSCLLAGAVFAALFDEVSLSKGLALASGFGWYSLSGIVMTQAYDATWGSVALLNDLLRELLALLLIPYMMRRSPVVAVGLGGAISLDFALPVIQNAGGIAIVPLAIGFGFVANVLAPVLMLIFSTM